MFTRVVVVAGRRQEGRKNLMSAITSADAPTFLGLADSRVRRRLWR